MATHKNPLSLKSTASVRELRAFVAVYYSGTLSAAAERLSLSQPAVSMLLRSLEEKFGIRLFDRNTRTLRRTEASEQAIARAERALQELEQLSDAMRGLVHGERGRIDFVATSSVAQTLLPPVMRRYLDAYPDVRLVLDDCSPRDFVDTILANRVDFGIGTLEAPVAGLCERTLLTDTLYAVGLENAGLRRGRSITWTALAALPIVTVKGGYGIRRGIDAAARAAGVELDVAHELTLLNTAFEMAAAGLGVAVLPGLMLRRLDSGTEGGTGLVVRAIVRPSVPRRIAVVSPHDRTLTPAAERFVAMLEAELATVGRRKPTT